MASCAVNAKTAGQARSHAATKKNIEFRNFINLQRYSQKYKTAEGRDMVFRRIYFYL
jgi:hypothetical protein